MKQRSRRGAARVSAVWMIVVVVLFFVSLGFAYIAADGAAQSESARATASTNEARETARAERALSQAQDVSVALGFYDRSIIGAVSDPQAAADGLQQLKDTISDLGADVTDFERAVPLVVTAYGNRLRDIQTLTTQLAQLESQLDTQRQATQTVAQQKDADLQELRQKANDDSTTWDATKSDYENRLAQRTAERNQKDSELKQEQAKTDDLVRAADEAAQAATTRLTNLTKILAFLNEPEAADGMVASVSEELNLGWINLGARDRITRGMRFDVTSGDAGAPRKKGEASVINVREATAEVRFINVRDRFDPIVRGDVISNDLYSPDTVLNAVLVGRFSGTYNERELRVLLGDIGVNVQDRLDLTTTHLIVGSELYFDEDGEPVEDPIQPSELPIYKDAVAKGINIVSIEKLRHFFRK